MCFFLYLIVIDIHNLERFDFSVAFGVFFFKYIKSNLKKITLLEKSENPGR